MCFILWIEVSIFVSFFSIIFFFFFKQKTAYEMRISDWSSDVCSSDLFFAGRLSVRVGSIVEMEFGLRTAAPVIDLHPAGQPQAAALRGGEQRSEERRVGKECVSTCRSRGSPYH